MTWVTALLLTGVRLEEAFVQIAQALFFRAEPIERLDVLDMLRQVTLVLEAGLGIGEDLLDAIELDLRARVKK
jgi:hypothetical protein